MLFFFFSSFLSVREKQRQVPVLCLIWIRRISYNRRSYGLPAQLLLVGLVTWSELDVNIIASEEAWKSVWSCYRTASWVRGSERGWGDRRAVCQRVRFICSSLSANLDRCTNTPQTEWASLTLSEIKQNRFPAGSAGLLRCGNHTWTYLFILCFHCC